MHFLIKHNTFVCIVIMHSKYILTYTEHVYMHTYTMKVWLFWTCLRQSFIRHQSFPSIVLHEALSGGNTPCLLDPILVPMGLDKFWSKDEKVSCLLPNLLHLQDFWPFCSLRGQLEKEEILCRPSLLNSIALVHFHVWNVLKELPLNKAASGLASKPHLLRWL